MNLLVATRGWDPRPWIERLAPLLPGRRIDTPQTLTAPQDVAYALTWRHSRGAFTGLPGLRAIFSLGAGVDHALVDPDLPSAPLVRVVDPDLTGRMSEWVVLQTLLHHRQFRRYARQQRAHIWDEDENQPAAHDVRVGVLGLGEIGLDAARKLKGLGFDVAGWRRTPRQVEFPTFHGAQGLDALLARTDVLVCLLPLTPDTAGLLNAALFARLPRDGRIGPILINAGRGGQQVEADILQALETGVLKGASLDVFETEPLPQSSALWARNDVFVSPHNAGLSAPEAVAKYIAAQILAFERGEALRNVVDRAQNY